MKPEPTLIEKIRALPCLLQLEGAEDQIKRDGNMTAEVQAEIANKRVHLMRNNTKK